MTDIDGKRSLGKLCIIDYKDEKFDRISFAAGETCISAETRADNLMDVRPGFGSFRRYGKRNKPAPFKGHFHYRRHFLLVACCCVVIAVMNRSHFPGNLSVSFGLYGSLHAAALALALRARHPFWRMCIFIVLAATLSVVTLHVAFLGNQLLDAAAGKFSRYPVLGLSAAAGALAYGILIRWCGLCALNLRKLAAVSGGCLCAACVALVTASHSRYLGSWWIAALWWWAFSCGLWYFDRRR